ncbi:MAG: hypothetical protein V2B15_13760 [Bacteroidota bacterium]
MVFLSAVVGSALFSQIQNVNIGGSYSGTFMLSGSGSPEYAVAGSPYLSETWMFGFLEMKSDILKQARSDKTEKTRLEEYRMMISKINALMEKISDPETKAKGLALIREGKDQQGDDIEFDLRIFNSDFSGISGITDELQKSLLNYLERLRDDYEAQINDFFKLNGLFRYNLYAQEFEMVYQKDTFAITAPFNVKSISISNMKFLYGLYVRRTGQHPHLGSAYFQVLSDGDCKLLMRHYVKIKSGGGPVTYNWAGGADVFVQYQQIYYQETEGSEVILLKNRRKNIFKLFADKAEEMKKFIRAEDINIQDDAGLVRVFDYYNSLDS